MDTMSDVGYYNLQKEIFDYSGQYVQIIIY
jgi:hypothetical protein